jgi:hypothetical protein
MKKIGLKVLLPILIGILSISFVIPTYAQTEYLLTETDLPGWTKAAHGNQSLSFGSWSMSWYWQVWVNNDSWANATKGIALMLLDFSDDISTSDWESFKTLMVENGSAVETTILGFENVILWNWTNVWLGMAYTGDIFIIAFGCDTLAPASPFGTPWKSKAPNDSGADKSDIETVLTAQGAEFIEEQIPGFEFIYIFMGIGIIATMALLIKKSNKLKL